MGKRGEREGGGGRGFTTNDFPNNSRKKKKCCNFYVLRSLFTNLYVVQLLDALDIDSIFDLAETSTPVGWVAYWPPLPPGEEEINSGAASIPCVSQKNCKKTRNCNWLYCKCVHFQINFFFFSMVPENPRMASSLSTFFFLKSCCRWKGGENLPLQKTLIKNGGGIYYAIGIMWNGH